MDEEREMCQNCKKDIPIVNYRTHTLHCARNMVKCRECEAMVGRPDLESHLMEFHTLRVCNQCQVNVEAFKLPEHMKTLCSKRKLVCKFCNSDKLASEMTDHENRCGVRTDRCERCHEWVPLKDWDSHQSRYHGHMGRRFRERSVIANTNPNEESFVSTLPKSVDEENPMLPCEFCEGMIPMRKLLEHQAECVNPTNVRRSESITNLSQLSSSSLSTYRPLSGIRQYSTASLKRSPPSLQRKVSAPARYGTLDRHATNESVTHQTENVTSRHQTESNVTSRYISSHQSSDVTNRYSSSQTATNDASNRHNTSQQHTSDVTERHNSSQNEDLSSNKLPCEFCNELQEMEYLMKHQRSCSKNPESGSSSCYDSPSSLRKSCQSSSVRNYSSLNRAASVREARATTEDRTFGRSLSRQSSFTERSFSRRSDSIYSGGTSQMYTRGSLGLSRYNAGPDYAAATRRSALFDGYTGFAIYSSISQGLDEITYGGRRSRRNSVTESSYGYQRRGSLTGSAFEYSALVSATATANAMTSSNRYNNTNTENTSSPAITRDASDSVINSPKNKYYTNEPAPTSAPIVRDSSDSVINSPKSSTALSRQDSTRYSSSVCQSDSAYESSSSKAISTSSTASTISPSTMLQPTTSSSGAGGGGVISRQESLRQSKSSSKIERKVSFSGADPIVLESSPPKPKRIKEKSERRKKADSNKNCDDLFDQVSAKLRALEQEQQEKLELEVPQSPLSRVPPTSLFPSTSTSARTTLAKPTVQMSEVTPSTTATTTTVNVSATVTLNGSHSSVKVKDLSTPEVINSPYNDVTIAASFNDVITAKEESSSKYCQSYYTPSFKEEPVRVEPVYPELASPIVTDVTKSDVVIIRDKSSRGPGESKSSSKRNSLDNKTVQTLAQDLAAECAKAYALMESSLSKLSTDFAVGPFGLTPKNKKTRKSRPPPAEPLK